MCVLKPRKLGELTANERNPRRMSAPQRDALRKSLLEFGPLDGFVFNSRSKRLVGGHQRQGIIAEAPITIVERLKKPNAQGTIARGYVEADNERITYREVDWPIAKEKAAMLAANKHSGQWDETALAQILSELDTEGFDLDLTGFDEKEFAKLLATAQQENEADAEPQIDKADELRKKWKVERGQIWELGEHRLMCGDSTKQEDVGALRFKGKLMVTDPPYGVEYDANWRNEADRANGKPYGATAIGKVNNDNRLDWTAAWKLFGGDVAYVWHAGRHASEVQASLNAAGFEIRCQLIWAKNNFAISRGDYHWKHEPCWYAVRKGKPGHWNGDRSQVTLWDIDKPMKSETGHSTQKPVECMARPIRNNSRPGDEIYEPFSGSGTTIIGCEQLGRKCRAIEIDPGYVAVGIQRWADATGKTPRLL